MKKKTYVFNDHVLEAIEELKRLTHRKETQIVEEAIVFYLNYLNGKNQMYKEIEAVLKNLKEIVDKIETLSYKLGRCEAEKEFLLKKDS